MEPKSLGKASHILKEGARSLNINLSKEKVMTFIHYLDLLNRWNSRINLTSIRKLDKIITKHFIDSLTILKFIPPSSRVVDIGSGAGFPGIPIKIAEPSIRLTLIESAVKKANFLRYLITTLKIDGVDVISKSASDQSNLPLYQTFDVAVARAVSALKDLFPITIPFVRDGGKIIVMKGPRGIKEYDEVVFDRKAIGIKPMGYHCLDLPISGERRCILIFGVKEPAQN